MLLREYVSEDGRKGHKLTAVCTDCGNVKNKSYFSPAVHSEMQISEFCEECPICTMEEAEIGYSEAFSLRKG